MINHSEIARHSRTDRSGSEAQKCISSIPAGSEQYSNRRLRRFPLRTSCSVWLKNLRHSVKSVENKKMTNEPNFRMSKIAVSNFSTTACCLLVTDNCRKNEPKRSQLSQTKKTQNKPI
jgi:hypothetical protein